MPAWVSQGLAALGAIKPNFITFAIVFVVICAVGMVVERLPRFILLGCAVVGIIAIISHFAGA